MEGQMELMRRYQALAWTSTPRAAASGCPSGSSRNSLANARNPECKTSANGVGIYGCWEARRSRSRRTATRPCATPALLPGAGELSADSYLVNANGDITLLVLNKAIGDRPYSTRNRSPTRVPASTTCARMATNILPVREAGSQTLRVVRPAFRRRRPAHVELPGGAAARTHGAGIFLRHAGAAGGRRDLLSTRCRCSRGAWTASTSS